MVGAKNLGMGMLPSGGVEFDPIWYAEQNPGIAAQGVDPTQHYELFGKAEGRAGSPAQLAAGLWSQMSRGDGGGAAGSPEADAKYQASIDAFASNPYGFDPNFYLSQRPDVAASKADPLQHFLQYGKAEGSARNAYEKTHGLPGAGPSGVVAPPPAAPALNPNDPASWAAWAAKAGAQTQGLNRMPNVAPSTDTLSADPLAVRQQFYPRGNNAGYVFPGAAGAGAAPAGDPAGMTPEQRQMMMINLGMKL